MRAIEIIKDIGTAIATSGLKNEVISLLEKKLTLLKEDLLRLTTDLDESAARESKLQRDNAQLRQKLQDLQPAGFVEHMGVLWKRTAEGFDPHAYCKECKSHPIMSHLGQFLVCGSGDHHAPRSVRPPSA